MLTSEESYVVRVFYFEAEEKADSLEGVEPFVNVISQENVLVAFHLVFIRESELLEDSQ